MAMSKAERRAFDRGYTLACCNLVNLHGEPNMAADVFSEAGITKRQVRAMDLSDYDRRAFREIVKGAPPGMIK